ncbi:hypothetical protein C2S52_018684 [Perilla frutescens var. hirtella]|nr:hypothetical protein C2S52_018684 [Perilla frutescens var. hirtella]
MVDQDNIPRRVRQIRPPTITYSPSQWGDLFTTFSFDDQLQEKYADDIEALKKETTTTITTATSTKLMVLIDKLERLGLAFYFQAEIDEKLQQVYNNSSNSNEDDDLFTTALRFRLLRQHEHHVSCNVFDKFVDEDNKFKETLSSDVEGLLSLYEAAHVRIHNENILDEAVAFTVHHLTNMLLKLESPIKERVQQALKHSIHRGIPILNVRFYISVYEREGSTDELLVKLAKLNFNYLQNIYRKELSQLSRWWNKFDLKSKLPYARDRVVECYLWGQVLCCEPQYSCVRLEVAKSVLLVTVMDDTYDNYATLEEADLFTMILERWDMDEIDVLPDYMKTVYKFIMSLVEDYEHEAEKQGKSYVVPYYKETVKQLGRAYNQEQKWIMEEEMPCFEEYMRNSIITSCVYVMFTALVPGMKSVTEESIHWLLSGPKIVTSTAKIGRHLQDLGSHERENRNGKLLTVVDCYMKDKGSSKQEAISKFAEFLENEWKDVTEEWSKINPAPKKMVEQLLNYCRASEVTYKNNKDGYTDPENSLTSQIGALYLDPLLI